MRRVGMGALAAALVVALLALYRGDVPCTILAAQPACQVAMEPGPTEDAFELIAIGDAEVSRSAGELRLSTVAVQDDLSWGQWFALRRSEVADALPRAELYPPGSEPDEVAEDNAALMADSQQVATIAALEQLGYELEGEGARVAAVGEDAVTDELAPGDVIVAVDGRPVSDNLEAVDAVQAGEPGGAIELAVADEGSVRSVSVTPTRSPQDADVPYIGVLLTTELDLPVDVRIDAGRIGGPSAGMMFALTIVDLLEGTDLTGGRVIAGTGTIDRDGDIGPVGGVRQKLAGASAASEDERPADVFLVPRSNLAAARTAAVGSEVLLVPVATLADALDALETLRGGQRPPDAVTLETRAGA